MEQTTLLYNPSNIYNRTSLDSFDINLEGLAGNKLFCTFSTIEDLDELVYDISSTYDILYGKIFILYIQSNNEYACTYNVDTTNLSEIPSGTILVHRKKESNTLYTINALNELIRKLNGGVVDTKFPINWQHYKNCILLTQHNELKQLNTKIHKIIEI